MPKLAHRPVTIPDTEAGEPVGDAWETSAEPTEEVGTPDDQVGKNELAAARLRTRLAVWDATADGFTLHVPDFVGAMLGLVAVGVAATFAHFVLGASGVYASVSFGLGAGSVSAWRHGRSRGKSD